MMFSFKGWRSRAAAAISAVLLLASCGGGSQVNPFHPRRVLAFGDETSSITADGRKYSVNFVTADAPTTVQCLLNPLWVQLLATNYGLQFRECPPAGVDPATLASRILAQPHTGVAELVQQIDAVVAGDGFRADDLVTVLTGANDVRALDAQAAAGTLTVDQAVAQAQALGVTIADQVNRIAELGAKVLVSTVPDQSLTPAGRADAARQPTLRRLTQALNTAMRTGLINDGHKIGLMLFDETLIAIVNVGTFNTTDPICDDATSNAVASPDIALDCTMLTLRANSNTATWIWADTLHLAPVAQSSLGSLAVARATNNPF